MDESIEMPIKRIAITTRIRDVYAVCDIIFYSRTNTIKIRSKIEVLPKCYFL